MSNFNENAKWRYATKKYDSSQKISNENIEKLKEAAQLSASSFGLQPYKIIDVVNPEVRQKLMAAAWNQQQIVDASHVFILANIIDFDQNDLNDFFENVKSTRNISDEDVAGYRNFVSGFVNNLPTEAKNTWTSKQAYIVLSNLLNAAAELQIDATPMEGFVPEQVNEILGLSEKRLHASLIVCLGYRAQDDVYQSLAKVRKPMNDLFITI